MLTYGMSKDHRLYHVVRSMRSMRRFALLHKRRLGANRLSLGDFYNPEQKQQYQNHVLDVGSSLQSYGDSPGEQQFRRWLVSLVDQHWRMAVLAHSSQADDATKASDLIWWNLLVEANDRIQDFDHMRMMDVFDELDAALDARNATMTTQAFVLAKLGMP
jgi:hypothetical protein